MLQTMKCAAGISMTCLAAFSVATLVAARAQYAAPPETVDVEVDGLGLKAQLWRPAGNGPFPAVLFNHGSYGAGDPLPPSEPQTLGPLFARHGYVFLWLHRQGTGLSIGRGTADGDRMARAFDAEGVPGRNRVQLELLENEDMNEAAAALARLRGRADVDAHRLGVVGHSFGGSLAILMAARHSELRAVVIFGGAANSWNQSAALRERLLAAVAGMSAAALFIHAGNDYSTAPGTALAAEMERRGRPHALRIYPPFGTDARAGHNLIFRSVRTWESDVFAFLDDHLRQ
jgi:carboxymethylenebutenolidase